MLKTTEPIGAVGQKTPSAVTAIRRVRKETAILAAVGLTLCTACILPVWAFTFFPTQNGPSLLLTTFMLTELDNPAYGYSEYYELHAFPIPYLAQTAVLRLLLPLFAPLTAEKVWVTIVLLLRCAAVYYFLASMGRHRTVYTLAALPLLYDFCLMRGYFNYHAGVSIGMIVSGYYIRRRAAWTRCDTAVFTLLILVQYFTHPVALALTGLLLASYEIAHGGGVVSIVRRVALIIVRGYVPSLLLLASFGWWTVQYGSWVSDHVRYGGIVEKIENVHYRGATPLSVGANLASLGLLALVGVLGLRHALGRGRKTSSRRRLAETIRREPMLLVCILMAALYMLMPSDLFGWHKADVRVIPVLFVCVLAMGEPLRMRWQRAAFAGVASVVTLAGLIPITGELHRLNDELAEYTSGMQHVPRRSKILPIYRPPERAERWRLSYGINCLRRADSLYALARGGASGNSLARNNTVHLLWYRDYASPELFPPVDQKNPTTAQIERAAKTYDVIILWDCDEKLAHMFSRYGYQDVFQNGRLRILLSRRSSSAGVAMQ